MLSLPSPDLELRNPIPAFPNSRYVYLKCMQKLYVVAIQTDFNGSVVEMVNVLKFWTL